MIGSIVCRTTRNPRVHPSRWIRDMHSRVLTLPEITAPVTLTFDPSQAISDDAYYDFCVANPDLRIERSPHGKIIIVPPAGAESDHRSLDAASQLMHWARKDGRGKAFGSSVEFILPSGAAYSPDGRGCQTRAYPSSQRSSAADFRQRARNS